jgi:plastocyanin
MAQGWTTLMACVSVMACAAAASADVLTGTVTTKTRPGTPPAPAVVYAEPLAGSAPARPGTFSITQKNKTFVPRVLGVPVGSTVAFPNDDAIFHNVFSLVPSNAFDLGLYRAGASRTRRFTTPGVVRVFCNIHPQMAAFVVVAPSPYVVAVDPDGRWRLDVPAGRYRVTALSERGAPATADTATEAGATVALALDESGFVAVPHANKFGLPYPPEAYKKP